MMSILRKRNRNLAKYNFNILIDDIKIIFCSLNNLQKETLTLQDEKLANRQDN